MHGILILANLQESPQGALKMQTSETHLGSLNHSLLEYDLEPCLFLPSKCFSLFFFFSYPQLLTGILETPQHDS